MADATSSPKATSTGDKSKSASPNRSKTASPAGGLSPGSTREEVLAAAIEVDDAIPDNDSTIEDRISSYTASLTSSVIDYPTENGRRYHAFRAGAIGNKLFLAPIDAGKVHNVLDIGTGTGIWAIEAAEIFPNAKITGNDLSAIQPTWVPPNVHFEVDDVESPWLGLNGFDFIFCRYMLGAIADWPKLMERVYENTKEGGWVEFQDYDLSFVSDDGSLTEEHETMKWVQGFIKACETIGRNACPGPHLEEWVKDAGFTDVVHQRFKLPIGPWPKDPHYKELGIINLIQLMDGAEAFTFRIFCDVLGWTRDECIVMLAKVRNELKSNSFHARMEL
ncbi:Secondary metabolism regulator LAE1 [Colletotrichum tropicale]|nr:Secondary metabolism regulator LAE1 [Colletotrichum tropicale]